MSFSPVEMVTDPAAIDESKSHGYGATVHLPVTGEEATLAMAWLEIRARCKIFLKGPRSKRSSIFSCTVNFPRACCRAVA